jgi:hypothetical protein
MNNSFFKKDTGEYKFIVIGKQNKYSEADIKSMLCFLVDNTYVVFGDNVFQQSIGISLATNCAPLLADLSLYQYKAEFVQKILQDAYKRLAMSINCT